MAKSKSKVPLTTTQQLGSLIKSARDIMRKDKGLSGDIDRLPMLTWVMFLKFLDDLEHIHEQKAAIAGKPYKPLIQAPYRRRDWAAKEDGITGDDLKHFINDQEAVRPNGSKGKGLFEYLRHSRHEPLPSSRKRVVCLQPNAGERRVYRMGAIQRPCRDHQPGLCRFLLYAQGRTTASLLVSHQWGGASGNQFPDCRIGA